MGIYQRWIKRIFDFAATTPVFVVLALLCIPLIVALKLTGEGKVLFLQHRVGFGRNIFRVFKFATMLENSDSMPGGSFTTRDDPRLTPLGSFLRRSKINELPQLWNVLIGDMALVGPRPLPEKSFEMYSEQTQRCIEQLRPGVTGIASIVFRDEERLIANCEGDKTEFYRNKILPQKGRLESWYYANHSALVDAKILLLTVVSIFLESPALIRRIFPDLPSLDVAG